VLSSFERSDTLSARGFRWSPPSPWHEAAAPLSFDLDREAQSCPGGLGERAGEGQWDLQGTSQGPTMAGKETMDFGASFFLGFEVWVEFLGSRFLNEAI